jgi:cephalosporin-C deacetylase-like acetyl esterase
MKRLRDAHERGWKILPPVKITERMAAAVIGSNKHLLVVVFRHGGQESGFREKRLFFSVVGPASSNLAMCVRGLMVATAHAEFSV